MLKIKHFLNCIALALLSVNTDAAEWDATDKALLAAVEATYVLDWHQTREISAKPDRFYEKNIILGRHPSAREVNVYFISAAVATYLVADELPAPWRKLLLTGALAVEINVINRNRHIGLRVAF